MANQLSVAERAAYFNQSTRQNIHMLPSESCKGGNQRMQIILPKSRLLAKLFLIIDAEVMAQHTDDKVHTIPICPEKLIRRISLDLNNGFSPFILTGEELKLYNTLNVKNYQSAFGEVARGMNVGAALSGGSMPMYGKDFFPYMINAAAKAAENPATNKVRLFYELPVTLNERDPQGLILLQNSETSVTLEVCTGTPSDMNVVPKNVNLEIGNVNLQVASETFSLPAIQEAFPDLSVLKLVNGVSHSFMGNGVNTVKLSTGTIYRKLILKFEDEDGQPLNPDDFTSDIQLVFNQADINYSISADMLNTLNILNGGGNIMPNGVYYLDFSSQGFTNFGGTRDLIDTELLTEFWLKFGTTKRGKVSVISECIARVR